MTGDPLRRVTTDEEPDAVREACVRTPGSRRAATEDVERS